MVARDGDSVIFGQSAMAGGPSCSYTTAKWEQFVAGVKQGDFDDLG